MEHYFANPKVLRIWQYFSTVVGLIFRHPIVGVAIVALQTDGRIVLIQRRDSLQWALPGGFVDWGEDLKSTATREVREETGLSVMEFGRLVGVYSSPNRDPRVHSICIAIVAQVEGLCEIIDKGEVISIESFSIDALPMDNLAHDHQQILNDYLTNNTALS